MSAHDGMKSDSRYPSLYAGWEMRLVKALEQARAHGSYGENSLFSKAMLELGVEPPARYRRVDWVALLGSSQVSLYRGDFYSFGVPLIAKFVLGYINGDDESADRVFADVQTAVESARRARSLTRDAKREGENLKQSKPKVVPLATRIDDALALLEAAVASHHLTGQQRMRLSRITDTTKTRIVRTRQSGALVGDNTPHRSTNAPLRQGTAPETGGDTLDATRSWSGTFRDNGQFGSHASFDAMDDESTA